MNPLPPCETVGVVDLCAPGHLLTGGTWFTLQVPNLIWFLAVFALVVGGIFLPFPTRRVEPGPVRAPAETP
jgi:hypothetical protein